MRRWACGLGVAGLFVALGFSFHCGGAGDVLSGGDAGVDARGGSSGSGGSSSSGSASGSSSGSGGSVCADPTTPAGCTACATGGHMCQANGCYGGYLCDTTTNKCKPPGSCP